MALGTGREWSWDGGDWVERSVPSTRIWDEGTAACFDERRSRIVLFGGGSQGHDWFVAYTSTPAGHALYGTSCVPVGAPVPDLFAIGDPSVGNRGFATGVRVDAPGRAVALLYGATAAATPFGLGCELAVGGPGVILPATSGAGGFGEIASRVPAAMWLRGTPVHVQAFALFGGGGIGASRGLRLMIGD